MDILTNDVKCDTLDTDAGSAAHSFLVTDMKAAVKTENRVNIFVNGRFAFSLDVAQVVDLKIKVGRRLSAAQLNECRQASEFGKLYNSTLEWILTRPHSVRETRDYLKRKRVKRRLANKQAQRNQEILKNETGEEREMRRFKEENYGFHRLRTREVPLYSDEDIERVMARLAEHGYLDDQKFAEYYVENRFVKKGISKKRLKLELQKKGVDSQIIEKVLANGERDDAEEIKKIIAKKRNKYTDDKLIRHLVRQGFDYQQSKDAVLGTGSQS